jgi:hypothetical protein
MSTDSDDPARCLGCGRIFQLPDPAALCALGPERLALLFTGTPAICIDCGLVMKLVLKPHITPADSGEVPDWLRQEQTRIRGQQH